MRLTDFRKLKPGDRVRNVIVKRRGRVSSNMPVDGVRIDGNPSGYTREVCILWDDGAMGYFDDVSDYLHIAREDTR